MMSLRPELLADETILFQTKKHFIMFLPSVIITLIFLFFLFNTNYLILKVAFLPGIAAALSWMNDFLLYYTSRFAVTNKRVLMREGFFYKHTNEMRLSTIANVSVTQSLLGQVLNYGNVVIFPFGGEGDRFSLIARPNEFVKILQSELLKKP